jgi:hypothetical protein
MHGGLALQAVHALALERLESGPWLLLRLMLRAALALALPLAHSIFLFLLTRLCLTRTCKGLQRGMAQTDSHTLWPREREGERERERDHLNLISRLQETSGLGVTPGRQDKT